jgi:hypothetical protein
MELLLDQALARWTDSFKNDRLRGWSSVSSSVGELPRKVLRRAAFPALITSKLGLRKKESRKNERVRDCCSAATGGGELSAKALGLVEMETTVGLRKTDSPRGRLREASDADVVVAGCVHVAIDPRVALGTWTLVK